ncbi:MAG: molybdopterin-dependent oxidoreductase [Actinobacteria bacterium]|nr:molybdopterin-dependent oxidoreductase [Actinomycetota bacterium]
MSACRNCYGRCSINGYVRNGRLIRVEGRPGTYSEGTVCSRAFAIPQLMNSPLRVRYPMKRVGARGEGKWQRITWDEAWDIIIPKFKEAIEQYGPNTILFNNGTGRDQLILMVMQKVFYDMGSVGGFGVGNICKIAGDFVQKTTIGNPCQFTGWDPSETKLIVWWARGLFSWGYYDWLYLKEAQERGAKLMVIDPRHTAAAAKSDLWVPLRPNSDMALALAIVNEMLSSKRFDKIFSAQWTTAPMLVNEDTGMLLREADFVEGGSKDKLVVWDEVTSALQFWDTKELKWSVESPQPALFGFYEAGGKQRKTTLQMLSEQVSEWTVEKTAETTWLTKEQVAEAIELYVSSSPGSCFSRGQKTDFNDNSSGMSHIFTIMMALAGNYEIPGGNSVKPMNKFKAPAVFDAAKPQSEVRIKTAQNIDDYSLCPGTSKIYGNLGGTYSSATKALTTGQPFMPRIYWGANCEPIIGAADSHEIAEGLMNVDFAVNVNQFMSASGELADIILPAAHQNEVDRIEYAQSGHSWPSNQTASIRQPFTEPQGECRDEIDVLFELASRLGMDIGWKDKYEWFNFSLKACGMTFDEFREVGHIVEPMVYEKHKKGLLRKDKKAGFETKTGKVNIYSEELAKFGWGPLPFYREQPQTPISDPELTAEYPYILLTGGRNHQFFHSEYRESSYLRSIHPFPIVEINPKTAEENAIADGDWVCIETKMGFIKQVTKVTQGIDPRIVHCEHDWWFPEKSAQDDLHGVFECNPNSIVDNDKENDPAVGTANFGTMCRIYKSPDGPPKGIYLTPEELEAFNDVVEEA